MKMIGIRVDDDVKDEFVISCVRHKTTMQDRIEKFILTCVNNDKEKERLAQKKEIRDESQCRNSGN